MFSQKRLYLLLFCITIFSSTYAQKELYIRPGAGFLLSTQHLIYKDSHPKFRSTNHKVNPELSVDFFYRLDDRTDIWMGYQISNIAISYKMDDHRRSSSFHQHEFPIGIEWLLKDVMLYPMEGRPTLSGRGSKGSGLYFLALFRIKALTGITMSIIPQRKDTWSISDGQYEFKESIQPLHRHNLSVFGGVSFQFYNRQRDSAHFAILYHQGIRRIIELDVSETVYAETFRARLGSRGSYFAIQGRIPIRLKTFGS